MKMLEKEKISISKLVIKNKKWRFVRINKHDWGDFRIRIEPVVSYEYWCMGPN